MKNLKISALLAIILSSITVHAGDRVLLECTFDTASTAIISYNSKQIRNNTGATMVSLSIPFTKEECEEYTPSQLECDEVNQYTLFPDLKSLEKGESIVYLESYYNEEDTIIATETVTVPLKTLSIIKKNETLSVPLQFNSIEASTGSVINTETTTMNCKASEVERD